MAQYHDDEILDIFSDMADAIRRNRDLKPNPRTEKFIDRKMAQLCGVLARKREKMLELTKDPED